MKTFEVSIEQTCYKAGVVTVQAKNTVSAENKVAKIDDDDIRNVRWDGTEDDESGPVITEVNEIK